MCIESLCFLRSGCAEKAFIRSLKVPEIFFIQKVIYATDRAFKNNKDLKTICALKVCAFCAVVVQKRLLGHTLTIVIQ